MTGPSGCGKSSLFRTLAGINPYEDGQIIYSGVSKNNGDVIFVPQDPYIPDTTLQQILTFPKTGDIFSKAAMGAALEKVGLHHIIPYLNIKELTGSEMGLSGGERQRLNFARLLLHKPRIIGLDEVTSSLPAHDGVQLYQTLFEELPDSIIISIAHRTELLPLHNVVATIAPEKLSLNRHEPDREKSILVQTAAGAVVPVSKPLQL